MHGINFHVIETVCDWLARGDAVWLATITETWGASPRPVGSLFAYNSQLDQIAGSLSGGCIEEDLLSFLKQHSAEIPFIQRYGDTPEEQQRLQLPCGGSIELVIEYLKPERHHDSFVALFEQLVARKQVCRKVALKSGEVSVLSPPQGAVLDKTEVTLLHQLGPTYRLLIVGNGEITRYLVPMVLSLDFDVVVCDPREAAFSRMPLDEFDVETIRALPDDLIQARFSDSYCAIVALSHDPRVDDLAIMAALASDAFYVGAMGSKATSFNRRERLAQLDLPSDDLFRLCAPIGVNIGSKTPPEIAISVAAQLIKYKKNNSSLHAVKIKT